MKTVVFTYDRYDTLTTPAALESAGVDFTVLCHTEEQRARFAAAGRVDPKRLVVSGEPRGLNRNRQWYMDHCVEMGEWCLMLVDDWLRCTELQDYDAETRVALPAEETAANNAILQRRFSKPIDMSLFLRRADELAHECDSRGVCLGGFSPYPNPIYRARKKWRDHCLCDGRAWVVKKSPLRFDQNVQMVDDVCFSAQNLLHGSGLLVNMWVLPECRRFSPGAFGSIKARMDQKIAECAYLVATYCLIEYAAKAGWPSGSHVRIVPRHNADKVIGRSLQQSLL